MNTYEALRNVASLGFISTQSESVIEVGRMTMLDGKDKFVHIPVCSTVLILRTVRLRTRF